MSTISSAIFNTDSDDEQDPDFVPDGQSDSSDKDTAATAAPPVTDTINEEAERAAQKEARASLWASFQSSITGTSSTGSGSSTVPIQQTKLVKIEKKYRFAGEDVSEVIEVPEGSEEAKRWPLWKPSVSTAAEATAGRTMREAVDPLESRATSATTESIAQSSDSPNPSTPSICPAEPCLSSSAPPAPAHRRPGPRKPKTTLAPLPSRGKPKKLTTLEKSAMDWRAHVAGADAPGETAATAPAGADSLADELERNRRGGGYLEKVAFLERVGDRREELFEDSRKKRRKG